MTSRLLFIHGIGDGPSVWTSTMSHPLMSEYQCEAVKLPGFGGTLWDGRTVNDMGRAIAARIESEDVPTVLVGHSMGGTIATLAAAAKPQSLIGLINVDSGLTEGDRLLSERAVVAADIKAFIAQIAEEIGGRYANEIVTCDAGAFLACSKELFIYQSGLDFAELFAGLQIPKTYFYGSRAVARSTRDWLKRSSIPVVEFASAGHWLMEDEPELFVENVRRWVDELG